MKEKVTCSTSQYELEGGKGGWIVLRREGGGGDDEQHRQTIVAPNITNGEIPRVSRATRRPKSTRQITAEKKTRDS